MNRIVTLLAAASAAALATTALLTAAEAKTLRWSAPTDIATLDPYAQTESFTTAMLHHVFDPLVRRGRTMQLEPALATSWKTVKPDTWRFKLRQGVKFHNGKAFTADDVVASVTRLLDPGARARGNLSHGDQGREGRRLDRRYRHQGSLSAAAERPRRHLHHGQGVDGEDRLAEARQHRHRRHHLRVDHANGTGAVQARKPTSRTPAPRWSSNPDWWDKPEHNLKRIEFRPIKSDATRVAALLSGELDMIAPAPAAGSRAHRPRTAPSRWWRSRRCG